MVQTPKQPRMKRFANYLLHVLETVMEAPFARGWWPYFVITGGGIAAVSWLIPQINNSHTGTETLGVYVLGILLTVFADAVFLYKKDTDDQIAETVLVVSFILVICTGILSTKKHYLNGQGINVHDWRPYADFWLWILFGLAVLMWAMLNVVEPKFHNSATQDPATAKSL